MSYKLPTRIFYIDTNGLNPLILRFSIIPINNTLLLNYELYQLMNESKEYFVKIEKEFFDNPEEENLLNRLNKKLLNSNKLGISEIHNFHLYLQNKLNTITRQDLSVQINLIFNDKLSNISLMPFQVFSLSTFILGFGTNYELYKLKIFEILEKEKAANTEIIVKEELKQEKAPLNIETQQPVILNEVINLASSNLTIYYLTKILNSVTDNLTITNKDNVYLINLEPLYNLCMTKQNELLIYNQLLEINLPKEEIVNKTKQLFKALNMIVIDSNNHKDNIHNVYIIIYLLFLYGVKLSYEIAALNLNYSMKGGFEFVLNKTLTNLSQLYKLNYNIQIEFNKNIKTNIGYKLNSESFDIIIKKHSYLANLDKKAFVNAVLGDLSNLKDNIIKKSKPAIKFLTQGNLLNIDTSLAAQLINPSLETSLLNYRLMDTKDSTNRFITKHYFDLYILISLNIQPLDNSLHKIIRLYYNQLIEILNNLDNSKMLDLGNISTLFLLDNFIEPILPAKVNDLYDQLFILYQIIIPHLYNKRKTTNFIDYFH